MYMSFVTFIAARESVHMMISLFLWKMPECSAEAMSDVSLSGEDGAGGVQPCFCYGLLTFDDRKAYVLSFP